MDEPSASPLVGALTAVGLFAAGLVGAVVALVVLGRMAAGTDAVAGWVRVGLVFGLVGVPGTALAARSESRAFGLGMLAGTALGILAVLWFVEMFHPYGTE